LQSLAPLKGAWLALKYRCPAKHEGFECPMSKICNAGKSYGKTSYPVWYGLGIRLRDRSTTFGQGIAGENRGAGRIPAQTPAALSKSTGARPRRQAVFGR
jgi:hypothetical protein